MFLKRLELAGFKSFADKTELEFVQGITGVVGPNGSGKSNISDAIRWVLGEQSAKSLRGGKMEDIIFAGSDARKAVNYGEVSLTLDNTDQALSLDFNEVTVTRRVHRSGDSEYYINKQPCRLKDITELFMDTGIGREAYSIIGQGRIEEILSSRSEDRRGIFEEASGIVKYKSRKREAERKLDDTEQNLLRIRDLISELEVQVEPLRLQSEQAELYKQLRDELKTKEISLYIYQIEEVYRSWTEAGTELEALKQEQLKLSTIVNRHDAELEVHRLKSRQLEEEIEQLQTRLLYISSELEKSEGFGEVLKERRTNMSHNREQLLHTIESGMERIGAKGRDYTRDQSKLAQIEAEIKHIERTLRAEEERLSGVNDDAGSETEEKLKGELFEVLNSMSHARNELRYIDQQMETMRQRQDQLLEDEERSTAQQAALKEARHAAETKVVETATELVRVRERYLHLTDQTESIRQRLEEGRQMIRRWEQRRDALVSRRDTMEELQNDYDGFMHGVKEVLRAKRKSSLQGVHGAVAELIQVQERVETAIETALGGALQHIVMSDEPAAREAIAFLKRRQVGRATFFPLTVIRPRIMPEPDRRLLEQTEGFVGIGADLVDYDRTYEPIVRNLLGQVIIADNLELANRMAARCQYRYRVVTLEGDVVNAGGSMTGGSLQKKNASLLGRQRQIDQLNLDIAETEQQLVKLRDRLDDLKKEQSIQEQTVEELRKEGEALRLDEQQQRSEQARIESELRRIADQLSIYAQERTAQSSELARLERQKEAERRKLEEQEQEEGKLQQAIQEAIQARKNSESARDELQTYLTDLKVNAAALMQEKQSMTERIEALTEEIRELEQELELNRGMLQRTERELEQAKLDGVRQIEQVNEGRIQKQKLTEQMEYKRAERLQWQQQLEQEEEETREQRQRLREVEEAMRSKEIGLNRLDVELEHLLKKLSEDYELSYELAKERYPMPEDLHETQQIVRDLKRRITALGEVNLGAIEEYERVRERYRFLSEQEADLTEAKAALYQVIREMDEEMSRRFRKTFDAVRGHFVSVFAKLFGGGKADLLLIEPDRILDTGIDIIAQPPGKKLQNLQLLSGGERALTAIALLFAILLVKPVPFCVLDEVEAALDEANVSRFAQYLREFSEQTQFIVVTHRKGTMEEADVLYGVTMEEGGVSKLVSVRLDEEDAVSA